MISYTGTATTCGNGSYRYQFAGGDWVIEGAGHVDFELTELDLELLLVSKLAAADEMVGE